MLVIHLCFCYFHFVTPFFQHILQYLSCTSFSEVMHFLHKTHRPAGLYRYFGTYNDGTNHGGTSINKLIVLDALKVAQAD